MITIRINEETKSNEDMASMLREIADKIEQGYTTGLTPNFELSGDEEIDEL